MHLNWDQFLFGLGRYPDYRGVVWSLQFGPFTVNYYRNKEAK